MVTFFVAVVCLAVGFVAGKVEGARIVAKVEAVVAAAEIRAETDVKKVIAAIRSKI